MYTNGSRASVAATSEFWTATKLVLDVDDAGAEGAAVTVRWEPVCGGSMDTAVHERTIVALPACEAEGPRRLVVEFHNDDAHAGFDRNVYVSLTTP